MAALGSISFLHATTYNCSSVEDIRAAMSTAGPGDEIIIAAGTYYPTSVAASGTAAHFFSDADGTASAPIILRSADPANPALLEGENSSSLSLLRILGDHWVVRDLRISNAQKGIVFDNANYGKIINCEVFNIGHEAIHIRDGSDYTLIDSCAVHHTGLNGPGIGEGIYVGSNKSAWDDYDPYVFYTTIRNCTIGPEISAEAFDIKEGTAETIIEYCTVDAAGISGSNYADSFIDLKGTRTYVRYNTFIRNGGSILNKGIAGIDRNMPLSCYEHAIHDNVFYMDTPTSGPMVDAYSGTYDIYAWDNIRYPAGDEYGSRIITTCCPLWYNPGGPACSAPTDLNVDTTTITSATLSWVSDTAAINYDFRYQASGSSTWTEVNGLTATTYQLDNLLAGTTYNWAVRSYCNDQQSAYLPGPEFTTLADTTSSGGGSDGGDNSDDDTPGALVLYDDVIQVDWNDYSFGGSYDLSYTSDVAVGSQAIRADYGSWGGINIKHDATADATGLTALRFWVKGTGEYLIRIKVNGAQYEFTTTTSWQQITLDLTTFGSPSSIESVVFQNRSSSSRTVYFDQIEFLGTGDDTAGGGDTGDGDGDDNGSGDNPPSPFGIYTDALGEDWNNYSFSGTYDLSFSTDVAIGSQSIRADYSGWGGLNLKKGTDLDASGLTDISFWVKGEGAYLIRMQVNSATYEFTTTTEWQQITLPLSTFGSPSYIDAVKFQNRSSSSRTVYFDQIEFLGTTNLQVKLPETVPTASLTTALQLYPNPLHNGQILTVQLPQLASQAPTQLQLLNLNGQQLASYELVRTKSSNLLQLPSHLPSGLYLIQIQSSKQYWRSLLRIE